MKLNCVLLPIFMFAIFGYGVSVLERADTPAGVTTAGLKAVVKHDLDTSVADYSHVND